MSLEKSIEHITKTFLIEGSSEENRNSLLYGTVWYSNCDCLVSLVSHGGMLPLATGLNSLISTL